MEKLIRKTALYDLHKDLGGNIIDFHGVYLPVFYTSIQEEHLAVRNNMGLFDVSHMGNIMLRFTDRESAVESLNDLLANDYSRICPGKIIYSTMLNEEGTVIDDLLVMSLSETDYHVVVNFTNIDKDFAHIEKVLADKAEEITNLSDKYSIIALQGPNALSFIEEDLGYDLTSLKSFTVKSCRYNDKELLISRTGYTGEDGVEFIVENADSPALFKELLEKGQSKGLIPCGLGARDTLRLEAALPLYGQELDDQHSPLQSMIKWSVKLKKEDFIGKSAITAEDNRFTDIMVGFEVEGRAIARTGMKILNSRDEEIGTVTSGTFSPTLSRNIGIAYIKQIEEGLKLQVRNRVVPVKIVDLPFYKRSKN